MKVAPRELNLLGMTLAILLLALTYMALRPRFQEWTDLQVQRGDLLTRRTEAQHYLDIRESVEARLQEFRQGLPLYSMEYKVEADLIPGLERMADQNQLQLTRSKAGGEVGASDLYEIAITCDWTGDLSNLVHFLFAQQSQGVVSDVSKLLVGPDTGRGVPPGRLKGDFIINYAYRRDAGTMESAAPEAGGQPAEESPQP